MYEAFWALFFYFFFLRKAQKALQYFLSTTLLWLKAACMCVSHEVIVGDAAQE